jgi:crossover junction endodeoxyribonuclease RuvC
MTATADVVVIEGLSFGSKGSAVTDLAGLHWLVRHTLWKTGVPYAVVAHPTMAKWLTGKGNAGKDECLAAAIKRFPLADITGNDEADALTLAAMGCARYKRPLVQMPADRTVVLSAVEWPQLNRRTAA